MTSPCTSSQPGARRRCRPTILATPSLVLRFILRSVQFYGVFVIFVVVVVAVMAQQHRDGDDGAIPHEKSVNDVEEWERTAFRRHLQEMVANSRGDDTEDSSRIRNLEDIEEEDYDFDDDDDDDDEQFQVYGIGVQSKGKSSKNGGYYTPPKRPNYPPPQHRPPRPTPNPAPRPDPLPIPYPMVAPVQPPVRPTIPSTNGCASFLTVKFLQFSALPPGIVIDPNNPDHNALGTQYVYGDSLYNYTTTDEIRDSRASGVCTRTQQLYTGDGLAFQVGGGFCQFTYRFRHENKMISIVAAGDVFDGDGGVLAITGGSMDYVGAYGEVELLPAQIVSNGHYSVEEGDFFLAPLIYLATAKIYVPQRNTCSAY